MYTILLTAVVLVYMIMVVLCLYLMLMWWLLMSKDIGICILQYTVEIVCVAIICLGLILFSARPSVAGINEHDQKNTLRYKPYPCIKQDVNILRGTELTDSQIQISWGSLCYRWSDEKTYSITNSSELTYKYHSRLWFWLKIQIQLHTYLYFY